MVHICCTLCVNGYATEYNSPNSLFTSNESKLHFQKAGFKDRQHELGGGSVGKDILVKARTGGTIYNPSALWSGGGKRRLPRAG